MGSRQPTTMTEDAVVEAIRAGDKTTFEAVVERYRRQLQVHCYRMLGSFEDAEDMVQETFLRAWRSRASFEGRSLFRTWLYRIATNACLNALERSPRRVLPQDIATPVTTNTDAAKARAEPGWTPEIPWLQPYPDSRLEPVAATDTEPEAVVVSRETIELVFLSALQHLPPKQRTILILRDLLDFSAKEAASVLEVTVPAANSALQRARATMRAQMPAGQAGTKRPQAVEEERAVLKKFMDAWERADTSAMTALLRDDARWAMPPAPLWFDGRGAIHRLYEKYPIDWQGRSFRMLPTSANRQPATAAYLRARGEPAYQFTALHVLRIEEGQIAEVTTFSPELCSAFDLPPTR